MTQLYETSSDRREQQRALSSGEVPVAVYGLGKMGLPLAATYAEVTGNTIGVDVDETVVDTINRGGCHIVNEPGLPELVEQVVENGTFRATTESVQAAETASVHVIIVPTLLDEDNNADLVVVRDVASDIAAGLEAGDMVVLESTVPPHTCQEVLLPLLERESGLDRGEFGLAFCPERTASGRALRDIQGSYPKVVGGVDDESTAVASLVYDEITANDVLTVADATTAEAVKVFEGLYRDVNIALANQVALMGEWLGIDVHEAIETANTQPLCDILSPGPGVGGHCIPVYPYFVINEFEGDLPLLTAARSVNDQMPSYTVDRTRAVLSSRDVDLPEARVGVFGLTYKANIQETRNSPAIPIISELAAAGATVFAADPLVTDYEEFESATLLPAEEVAEESLDAALLVTAHDDFAEFDWQQLGEECALVDCRGTIDPESTTQSVYRLGSGYQK